MNSIVNFGLRWERRYIDWGRQRKEGSLWGYIDKKNVNFRTQLGIYMLHSKGWETIYIGQTGKQNLFLRLRQHRDGQNSDRWEYFSWFGIKKVIQGEDAEFSLVESSNDIETNRWLNQIEGLLIYALEPGLNKQGARWKGVERYYQYIDESLYEPTNKEIMQFLKKFENYQFN